MSIEMKKIKNQYSLNDAELAYLVYMQIDQNIHVGGEFKKAQHPMEVYNSGFATLNGLTSLFKIMCNFMGIESGLILGYVNYNDNQGNILNED